MAGCQKSGAHLATFEGSDTVSFGLHPHEAGNGAPERRTKLSRRELLGLTPPWFALNFQFAALLPVVIPAQILLFVAPGSAGNAEQAEVLGGLAALAFVVAPSQVPLWPLGVIFGPGYGAYTSVGAALAIDALPLRQTAGKDLGLWSMASTLSTVIAPVLGSSVIVLPSSQKGEMRRAA